MMRISFYRFALKVVIRTRKVKLRQCGLLPSCKAVDKAVAQVSKPAVSRWFQPARALNVQRALGWRTCCRLEIGDTAGWKPVGNLRYFSIRGSHQSPTLPSL